MKKQKSLFIFLGIGTLGFGIFHLVKNMPNFLNSSFSFGEFWSAQPFAIQSVVIYSIIAIFGVLLLFKAGNQNKVIKK